MTVPTLAILAGGAGTRMGAPKSSLTIAGQTILRFLAGQWNWPGATLLVTAPGNERPAGADAFTAEATDPVAGQGPLRGVLTAIDAATTDVLIIATVDMPGVARQQLDRLVRELAPADLALMTRRTVGDGVERIEPFPLVIRRGARDPIANRLSSGRRSVHGLATEPGVRVMPAPKEWGSEVWTNLNEPRDLDAFLRGRSGEAAGGGT